MGNIWTGPADGKGCSSEDFNERIETDKTLATAAAKTVPEEKTSGAGTTTSSAFNYQLIDEIQPLRPF
jgi:hypothetical protein